MSTDTIGQEEILTEILLMREEMREGLRRLSAIGPRAEIDYEARELGVANQAELESLRQEVERLRQELHVLKERTERFELEERRRYQR